MTPTVCAAVIGGAHFLLRRGRLALLLHLSQQDVYQRLKTSGILDDYIVPSYDVLHTFSSRYLAEEVWREHYLQQP